MQSNLLHFGRAKPAPADERAGWDPFASKGAGPSVDASISAVPVKTKSRLRLFLIIAMAAFGTVTMLPAIVAALMMPFHAGLLAHFALTGVSILGFVFIAYTGVSRVSQAHNAVMRLPAIRDPVRDAATERGLTLRGIITPERSGLLRTEVGDVSTALAFPAQDDGAAFQDRPDEFHGTFPDGSPFWCLIKKSTTPLAGVPEQYRQAGQPDRDATAQMLAMLIAFPERRRSGMHLQILHRFMQVRFARIATTLDTGSSEFNMRFFVAAQGARDKVPVFRAVTPALQTLLIGLFERFWLVNLVVKDTTAFLSAVAFSPTGPADEQGDAWISAALDDCIAGAARAKTLLD